jgi:hypothetical protein
MKCLAAAALSVAMLLAPAAAKDKGKDKPKEKAQIVDAGSFGIFVNGQRVATEKFQIEQRDGNSVATSELKLVEGGGKPAQTSEMELTASGDILHYTWHEVNDNKAQEVVEPANEFLVEHITANPTAKTEDQPFLLPHSTVILDDYFFSHRQILAWRYLASGCAPRNGQVECNLAKTQYGVLVPRQRLSMMVALEFVGKEKISLRGSERELNRINMNAEGLDWAMWLDDNNRVVRINVPGENTEVIRD